MKQEDKIIVITVLAATLIVVAGAGIIFYSKGNKKVEEKRKRSGNVRLAALQRGASKVQAEKEAALSMVDDAAERAKVSKELDKITTGKTEEQAQKAIVDYTKKIEDQNSSVLQTLKSGVSATVSDVKEVLSGFVTNVKSVAEGEYSFWEKNGFKETSASAKDRLRKYWEDSGVATKWDGKTDTAWSSAFISYIMKKAGAGKDWVYSGRHSDYIKSAIKNRNNNNANPFKAYKPSEVKIQVGDVLNYPRESGITYENALSKDGFTAHGDVVVAINNGVAETLGGNVSDSVSLTKVPLLPDGKIDTAKAKNKYFVVIKNSKA